MKNLIKLSNIKNSAQISSKELYTKLFEAYVHGDNQKAREYFDIAQESLNEQKKEILNEVQLSYMEKYWDANNDLARSISHLGAILEYSMPYEDIDANIIDKGSVDAAGGVSGDAGNGDDNEILSINNMPEDITNDLLDFIDSKESIQQFIDIIHNLHDLAELPEVDTIDKLNLGEKINQIYQSAPNKFDFDDWLIYVNNLITQGMEEVGETSADPSDPKNATYNQIFNTIQQWNNRQKTAPPIVPVEPEPTTPVVPTTEPEAIKEPVTTPVTPVKAKVPRGNKAKPVDDATASDLTGNAGAVVEETVKKQEEAAAQDPTPPPVQPEAPIEPVVGRPEIGEEQQTRDIPGLIDAYIHQDDEKAQSLYKNINVNPNNQQSIEDEFQTYLDENETMPSSIENAVLNLLLGIVTHKPYKPLGEKPKGLATWDYYKQQNYTPGERKSIETGAPLTEEATGQAATDFYNQQYTPEEQQKMQTVVPPVEKPKIPDMGEIPTAAGDAISEALNGETPAGGIPKDELEEEQPKSISAPGSTEDITGAGDIGDTGEDKDLVEVIDDGNGPPRCYYDGTWYNLVEMTDEGTAPQEEPIEDSNSGIRIDESYRDGFNKLLQNLRVSPEDATAVMQELFGKDLNAVESGNNNYMVQAPNLARIFSSNPKYSKYVHNGDSVQLSSDMMNTPNLNLATNDLYIHQLPKNILDAYNAGFDYRKYGINKMDLLMLMPENQESGMNDEAFQQRLALAEDRVQSGLSRWIKDKNESLVASGQNVLPRTFRDAIYNGWDYLSAGYTPNDLHPGSDRVDEAFAAAQEFLNNQNTNATNAVRTAMIKNAAMVYYDCEGFNINKEFMPLSNTLSNNNKRKFRF